MVVTNRMTETVEMLGWDTPVEWQANAKNYALLMCARGGEIHMNSVDGGTEPFVIPTHHPTVMTDYIKAGDKMYFTGSEHSYLSVVYAYTV